MAQESPDFRQLPLYEAQTGRHFARTMTDTSGEMAETPELGTRAAFVRGLLTDLAIMTAVGLFLGVLGPFGTIDLPLGVRLISWLAFAYIGYACYRPMAPDGARGRLG